MTNMEKARRILKLPDTEPVRVTTTGEVFVRRRGVWARVRVEPDWSGYASVKITRGGRLTRHRVHLLVLLAFHGPRPTDAIACHENDDRMDPRSSNLSWGTRKKNHEDAQRNGRWRTPTRLLSGVRLRQAKALRARGMSYRAVSEAVGLKEGTVFYGLKH